MKPLDYEKKWDQIETQLLIKFLKYDRILWAWFACFIWAVLFIFVSSKISNSYPDWTRLDLFIERRDIILSVVLSSVLSLYLKDKMILIFWWFVSVGIWIGGLLVLKAEFSLYYVLPLIFQFIGFVILKLGLKNIKRKFYSIGFLISLFFIFLYFLTSGVQDSSGLVAFRYYFMMHPEFFVMCIVFWIICYKSQNAMFVLHPIMMLMPLPLPLNSFIEDQQRRRELWWRGFLSVVFGSLVLLTYLFILSSINLSKIEQSIWIIPFQYLHYLIYVVTSLQMVTGIIQIFGLKVIPATSFLLLAKSPIEIWQRGSVYIYRAFLEAVFFPLYSRTRKLWFVIMICGFLVLLHMFWFHDIILQLFLGKASPFLSQSLQPQYLYSFLSSFIWGFVWIVIAVMTVLFWNHKIKNMSSRRQWISVVTTHVLAMLILPISQILVFMVMRLFRH